VPGGLAVAASGRSDAGTAQLGAFVQRSMVVAPPRVSVRLGDLGPAAVPDTARGGRAGAPATQNSRPGSRSRGASPTGTGTSASPTSTGPTGSLPGAEVDGPVIRRSLSGTAHSLFRSLLRSPEAPRSAGSHDPVQSGSVGMFSNQPQHGHGSGPDQPAVIRRLHESGSSSEPGFTGFDGDDEPASPAMRSRDFDELIDRIVAKLEQRVIDDLERRGRRHMPEVF
jgi:hypothetical protein